VSTGSSAASVSVAISSNGTKHQTKWWRSSLGNGCFLPCRQTLRNPPNPILSRSPALFRPLRKPSTSKPSPPRLLPSPISPRLQNRQRFHNFLADFTFALTFPLTCRWTAKAKCPVKTLGLMTSDTPKYGTWNSAREGGALSDLFSGLICVAERTEIPSWC